MIIQPPFFSLLLLKDDDEMRDSATARNNSYSLKSALYPCQDQYILFKKQNAEFMINSSLYLGYNRLTKPKKTVFRLNHLLRHRSFFLYSKFWINYLSQ